MNKNIVLSTATAAMLAASPVDALAIPGFGVERGWPFELSAFSDEDLECLALNIYHEARGESLEGMVAVTQVVLNRVKDPAYPDTPCEVVREDRSGGQGKCQFSWWCDGKSDRPTDAEAWETAKAVVRGIVEDELIPWVVPEVKHYVRCGIRQSWLNSMSFYGRIGNHCFYRDDDGEWEAVLASLDASPPEERPSFDLERQEEDGLPVLAYTMPEEEWLRLVAVEDTPFQSFRDEMLRQYAALRASDLIIPDPEAESPAAVVASSFEREPDYPVARFFANAIVSVLRMGPVWASQRTGGGIAESHPPRRQQSVRE